MQKALQASPESQDDYFMGEGMIKEVDPIVMAQKQEVGSQDLPI